MIEDLTPKVKTLKKRNDSNSKVKLSEFLDAKLPLFAKRCARMATCIVDLCPEEKLFSWPVFTEEIHRLGEEGRADSFLEYLDEIKEDPDTRDRFLTFVSDFCLPLNLISACCFEDALRCFSCAPWYRKGSSYQNWSILQYPWLAFSKRSCMESTFDSITSVEFSFR